MNGFERVNSRTYTLSDGQHLILQLDVCTTCWSVVEPQFHLQHREWCQSVDRVGNKGRRVLWGDVPTDYVGRVRFWEYVSDTYIIGTYQPPRGPLCATITKGVDNQVRYALTDNVEVELLGE